MDNLAGIYLKEGQLDKAETLERQVVSVRRRMLGEANPETLCAMRHLALIYHERGRKREAQELDDQIQQLTRTRASNRANFGTIPSIWNSIEPDNPAISDVLEQLSPAVLAHAADDLVCEATGPESPDHDEEGSETRDYDSAMLKPQENENLISTTTPMEDVFRLLLDSGCLDLTGELDSVQCPTVPYAGGRFGDVWCAVHQDQTRVAIKCLRLHTNSKARVKNIKRAARELYYWSKAKHENVLELKGIALFRGQLAMISPWMANGTLSSYIWKNPGVNRWELCKQVAGGLAYMHQIGMVHGDLKAVNILVSDEGTAKLSDFGNSILSDHSLAFTATTNIGGGTSRWMAPELLLEEDDEGGIPGRSMPADVYALGMTILEVLTGQLPYSECKSDDWATNKVLEGIPPGRPTQLSGDSRYGNERWAMLLECWQNEPESRPAAIQVQRNLLWSSKAMVMP
ncbi:hypothetical protein FRC12_007945 [Ceratobasidium sp. 428]|nr:hypothetical protein FRC12_007945 [Ceratobasidium sp. 428]